MHSSCYTGICRCPQTEFQQLAHPLHFVFPSELPVGAECTFDSPTLCGPASGDSLTNCEKPARGALTTPVNESGHVQAERRLVIHRTAHHLSIRETQKTQNGVQAWAPDGAQSSKSRGAVSQLCDPGQATQPLCASVSPSSEGGTNRAGSSGCCEGSVS